jgi:hypothetical protein
MSTWLWVLIIVVVLVLVFGLMRRRGRRRRVASGPVRLAVVLDQADSLVAWPVGPGPAGAADPPPLPGRAGSGTQPELGQWCSTIASSSLLE